MRRTARIALCCALGLAAGIVAYPEGVNANPDSGGLYITEPGPGIAGQVNQVTVYNATPGEDVVFVWSFEEGQDPVPGCPDSYLETGNAIIRGRVTADGQGVAEFSTYVTPHAAGKQLIIQAAQPATCSVSAGIWIDF